MSTFSVHKFGTTRDGREIHEIVMEDSAGNRAHLINFGAAIRCLCVKDRDGILRDVCLGYDSLREYEEQDGCLGATMGRCTNRTAKARVTLSGRAYKLTENRPGYHMHGGKVGFNKKVWDYEIVNDKVVFTYVSPDGEEGYPGTVTAKVLYSWNGDGTLRIEYDCVSDQETVINLTNHSYFNLNGGGTVLDHTLWLNAERITELGEGSIPTGRYIDVEGTPFDFRVMKPIGRDIDAPDAQLAIGSGYDHNFVLGGKHAATLRGDRSGIEMRVFTDMPGVQFYSANFLGERKGSFGRDFFPRCAAALETQLFPHAMRCYGFPSPVLRAGVKLHSETKYAFGTY